MYLTENTLKIFSYLKKYILIVLDLAQRKILMSNSEVKSMFINMTGVELRNDLVQQFVRFRNATRKLFINSKSERIRLCHMKLVLMEKSHYICL